MLHLLLESKIDSKVLPPENIFYISINEYDQLIQVLYSKSLDMGDILAEAVQGNRTELTKKFLLEMNLSSYDVRDEHVPYLEKSFNKLYQNMLSAFG